MPSRPQQENLRVGFTPESVTRAYSLINKIFEIPDEVFKNKIMKHFANNSSSTCQEHFTKFCDDLEMALIIYDHIEYDWRLLTNIGTYGSDSPGRDTDSMFDELKTELLNPHFETNPTFREIIGHHIHKLTTSPLEEMNIDSHEHI
jgi:hypothetical protein